MQERTKKFNKSLHTNYCALAIKQLILIGFAHFLSKVKYGNTAIIYITAQAAGFFQLNFLLFVTFAIKDLYLTIIFICIDML